MNMHEKSIEEMVAENEAGSHQYNCDTLMGNGALHVSPEFAPHIRAVLTALPFDINEKLMELKVAFLAVVTESVESEWIDGLRTDREDARNKIDCLWAVLWAICVWDRIDSLQTHDETSWHARRLLFRCLARRGAIWRLRTHVIYAQARF
jgi:hypothetical protein